MTGQKQVQTETGGQFIMMRALYSSVAGLKTHQTKMDVIGNNIANVNTVGFKSSRTTFATMMYQTTSFASGANAETGKGGINAKQIGLGTTFASTAINIDTGGSSESTGKAFDLKLSDKNSTSFYIVNTGTENVFTRAGAFYVDGAGNLCMESTGYTVMGWQVDANGNIRKDTVSPLKIMSTDNQTSQPEYTSRATCTGILDDNNSNVNSDTGYAMNLNFYDNLGYAYTARFAAQKTGEKGEYTINLTNILDSNGKSIINGSNVRLSDLFGTASGQGSGVYITDNYVMTSGMSGALRRLATQAKEVAGSTDTALTYTFPASVINQYLSYTQTDANGNATLFELDDEYTVKYTITNPGSQAPAYKMTILDRAGNTVNAADVLPAGWSIAPNINGTPAGNEEITKVETLLDTLQGWLDSNRLQNGTAVNPNDETQGTWYALDGDLTNALATKFKDLLGDPAPSAPAMRVIVKNPGSRTPEFAVEITDANYDANGVWRKLVGADRAKLADIVEQTPLREILDYGYLTVDVDQINERGIFTEKLPLDAEVRYYQGDGHYEIVTPTTDGFRAQFSTSDGSLQYIGQEGSTTQTLRMSNYRLEGDNPNPFSDIQIDFSTLQNLSNGGSSTAAMSAGNDGTGEGKRVGTMIGLSVDQSGKVYGSYSNGNTTLLGQIAVARFANASGLESIGENCYRTTMNSGEFDGIGVEMDSDGSTMDSGTLEMSNVDLATEFTQMITTQRGYQANSRVISTSDGILEELVNLKR